MGVSTKKFKSLLLPCGACQEGLDAEGEICKVCEGVGHVPAPKEARRPPVGTMALFFSREGEEPLAAIITRVHSANSVNLAIFRENGTPYLNAPTHVPLFEFPEPVADPDHTRHSFYAQWTP